MRQLTRNKFLRASAILIIANAAAKLLGAIFKIPLTYILREDGMAVYNTAFSVYITVMSLALGGFPFALTKILAEHCALGGFDRIRPLIRRVGLILFALGAAGSIIMYIFAPQLAAAMREPSAAGAIRAVSPSVALVALGAAYKSSNEACSDLIPTAVSQVSEAALKLVVGFHLAQTLVNVSVTAAAEGAIFGVTIGEAFATALLGTVWFFRTRKYKSAPLLPGELGAIYRIAFPLAICGAASGALSMCGIPVMRGALSSLRFTPQSAQSFLLHYSAYTEAFDSLPDTLRLTADGIRRLYGAYSGYAHTVFNLPVGIIAAISGASTPMIASALTSRDNTLLAHTAEKILSLVLTLSIPSAFACFFFSSQILTLLFRTDFAAPMLSFLAPAIIFISTANMLSAILHLSGRIFEPFLAGVLSLIVQLGLCSVLTRISSVNILGAPIACSLGAVCALFANSAILKSAFGVRMPFLRMSAVPFAASCVMCAVIFLSLAPLSLHLGKSVGFITAAILGGAVYVCVCALLSRRNGCIIIGKIKN